MILDESRQMFKHEENEVVTGMRRSRCVKPPGLVDNPHVPQDAIVISVRT